MPRRWLKLTLDGVVDFGADHHTLRFPSDCTCVLKLVPDDDKDGQWCVSAAVQPPMQAGVVIQSTFSCFEQASAALDGLWLSIQDTLEVPADPLQRLVEVQLNSKSHRMVMTIPALAPLNASMRWNCDYSAWSVHAFTGTGASSIAALFDKQADALVAYKSIQAAGDAIFAANDEYAKRGAPSVG